MEAQYEKSSSSGQIALLIEIKNLRCALLNLYADLMDTTYIVKEQDAHKILDAAEGVLGVWLGLLPPAVRLWSHVVALAKSLDASAGGDVTGLMDSRGMEVFLHMLELYKLSLPLRRYAPCCDPLRS